MQQLARSSVCDDGLVVVPVVMHVPSSRIGALDRRSLLPMPSIYGQSLPRLQTAVHLLDRPPFASPNRRPNCPLCTCDARIIARAQFQIRTVTVALCTSGCRVAPPRRLRPHSARYTDRIHFLHKQDQQEHTAPTWSLQTSTGSLQSSLG
jgi:hypothetical protein